MKKAEIKYTLLFQPDQADKIQKKLRRLSCSLALSILDAISMWPEISVKLDDEIEEEKEQP